MYDDDDDDDDDDDYDDDDMYDDDDDDDVAATLPFFLHSKVPINTTLNNGFDSDASTLKVVLSPDLVLADNASTPRVRVLLVMMMMMMMLLMLMIKVVLKAHRRKDRPPRLPDGCDRCR
jgi:hypothetical protein